MTKQEIIKKALEMINEEIEIGLSRRAYSYDDPKKANELDNITDLKDWLFDGSSSALKEDVYYTLKDNEEIYAILDDDCCLNFDDFSELTYRQLMNMYKKEYINK